MNREISGASGEPYDGGSSSKSHVSEEKEEDGGDKTKALQIFYLAWSNRLTREIGGTSASEGGSTVVPANQVLAAKKERK
jgi:hypothetical protein